MPSGQGSTRRWQGRSLLARRARPSWRRRAWRRAQAGRYLEALALHRALIALGPGCSPTEDLRDRFRLLRWELWAGCWVNALECTETLQGRLSRRGMSKGPAAGWVHLAQAVACFQLGLGPRLRAALASALRTARSAPCPGLRSAVLNVGAVLSRLRREPAAAPRVLERAWRRSAFHDPEEERDASGAGPRRSDEAEILELFRKNGPAWRVLPENQETRPDSWARLPELIEGPAAARRLATALDQPQVMTMEVTPEPGGRARREEANPGVGSVREDAFGVRPGDALLARWLEWDEGDPREGLPVWLVPILARMAERRAPEVDPDLRLRLHRALARLTAQVLEPWARAVALESQAEVALWLEQGAEGFRREPGQAVLQARADLALAAGLLQRLGWIHRAVHCERRWARLAWSTLGTRLAEAAPADKGATSRGRSLVWVRHMLHEAGFLTGDSRVLRDLAPLLLLAPTPLPVLILGESGTGKEVLARALHRWSRLRGEFMPIHCGAIPRELLESELFGHTRGAFTGAGMDKPGLVEAADGGSLFLDEIGEMGMEAQMKMLRVLENGEVRRLGDLRSRRARIRLVSATHRDLEAAVRTGAFRLDLYHRIRGLVVTLRPLRERRGDIPLLAGHYLTQAAEERPPLTLTEGGLAGLLGHHWPGNVRELRGVLLRAAHLARALDLDCITPDLLGLPLPGTEDEISLSVATLPLESPVLEGRRCPMGDLPEKEAVALAGLDAVLEEMERRLILGALHDSGWNRTQAALSLGGLSRTTLISKMKRLGIYLDTNSVNQSGPPTEPGAPVDPGAPAEPALLHQARTRGTG
jgi:DNA-binding NtrC family response regulator